MDEGPGDTMPSPRVVRRGQELGEGRKGSEGTTNSGGVRTAFRADRGCDKIGSDEGESHGDTTRREVVIEFVHDVYKS